MGIEVFSEYVTDRAFLLGGVFRELKLVKEILKNYPNGVNLPYTDSNNHQAHHYITSRVAFGMAICQRSLYEDLVSEDQEMLALEILERL